MISTIFLLISSTYSLADIQIPNIPDRVRENILPQLSLSDQLCDDKVDTEQMRLRSIKETDLALQALGYYQSQIELFFDKQPKCWVVQIKIMLPPPVILHRIKVEIMGEAQQLPAFSSLIGNLPVGKPLNHRDYENLKRDLLETALQYGFFNAKLDRAQLQVDVDSYSASIQLRLNPGVRYVFGVVDLQQSINQFDDAFLRRYWSFQIGDAYEQLQLDRLNQDLFNSGYFKSVSVLPQPTLAGESLSLRDQGADNTAMSTDLQWQVPVRIQLTPKPQHAYDLGAGAATDTGARVSVGYQNRYLTPQGWKLSQQMTVSEVTSDIQSKLTIPLQQPTRRHWEIYGGFQSKNTDTSQEDKLTVGSAWVTHAESGWQRSLFIDFQREGYQVGEQSGQVFLLIPGISWSKSRADDWVYPRNGWRLQSRLRVADERLASDTHFAQIWASAKYIDHFGSLFVLNRARMLLRAEAGFTEYTDFEALPSSIRFFAGGDSSVRGYDYQSLGPIDNNGDISGGPQLLVGSAELDYRVWGKWALATFIDVGNAFYLDDSPSLGDIDLASGFGMGLRWLSPLGPIRFDVAKALDIKQSVRLHLSMGPDL